MVARNPLKWTPAKVIKGVRYSTTEWTAVYALMNHLGLNYSDLNKRAVRELAERNDVPWPYEIEEKAS